MALYERILDNRADVMDKALSGASITNDIFIKQIIYIGETGQPRTHSVSDVKFYLKKTGTPASNIYFDVYECTSAGVMIDDILISGTIAKADVAVGFTFVSTSAMQSVSFKAGSYYCFDMNFGKNTAGNEYTVRYIEASYTYGLTKAFSKISHDVCITWKTLCDEFSDGNGTSSLVLQEYGVIFNSDIVSYLDIISLGGVGANATATSFDYVNLYVANAEGYVNAVTRYDWSANWASLNAKARFLVKEAIACLAAVSVVNYDTTGFTSRFEAQYVSDSLQFRSDKAVAALMDVDIKKFVQTP